MSATAEEAEASPSGLTVRDPPPRTGSVAFALVRQSEAMSSFVMERDALCASDRVSLWKITLFASVNLRCSEVIKRVRIATCICVFPNSLKSHALRCSRGESLFF